MSYSVKMDGVDLQCKGMECDTRKARAARLMIMCVSKAAAFNQKRPFFKKKSEPFWCFFHRYMCLAHGLPE